MSDGPVSAVLQMQGVELTLLPEKALYIASARSLLVSDVHLGKSETFQRFGIPVPSQVNRETLSRLRWICDRTQPENLWILGDLFHAREGIVDEVLDGWLAFLNDTQVNAQLIVGNHDRRLLELLEQLSICCFTEAVQVQDMVFSHEPHPSTAQLNICGHVHPVVRLRGGGDRLRLPCFFWEADQRRLTLPAFGGFTGGYEMRLRPNTIAYAIAEDQVVAFKGLP